MLSRECEAGLGVAVVTHVLNILAVRGGPEEAEVCSKKLLSSYSCGMTFSMPMLITNEVIIVSVLISISFVTQWNV